MVKIVKKVRPPLLDVGLGALGIVLDSQIGSWSGCDHKVYFNCLRGAIWVYSDEIELVKK